MHDQGVTAEWVALLACAMTIPSCVTTDGAPPKGASSGGGPASSYSPDFRSLQEALFGAGHDRPSDSVIIVRPIFDVARADLKVEAVRHSTKVWNHVDEGRMDAESTSRLARNGLRMGVADASSWPAIRAILEAADAEVRRDQLEPPPNQPFVLPFDPLNEPSAFFTHDRSGRLAGKTIAAGERLVSLDYLYRRELGGGVELHVGFEVRHDRGVLAWRRTDAGIEQAPDVERHRFPELEGRITLNPREMLIIGPSEEASNEYLAGARFFTRARAGERYETLLLVTPRFEETRTVRRPSP